MTVQALFVDTKSGPYPALLGSDACWDETRDARNYTGSSPVILHPPCARWSSLARINHVRWGTPVAEDGGLFAWALTTLRRCGGVLEHPAQSIAWKTFNLPKPRHGAWTTDGEFWSCEVHQVAYGHSARKKTWLLYKGASPPMEMNWSSPEPTHQVGGGINTGERQRPRLNDKLNHITPVEFAKALIALASEA